MSGNHVHFEHGSADSASTADRVTSVHPIPVHRAAQPARRRPRREASLTLRRVDPWSVLKVSLIVATVMFFVWLLVVGILYLSFGAFDVWSKINTTYESLASSGTGNPSGHGPLITAKGVFTLAAVLGAANVVLFTVLSTISALLYNAAAGVTGGVEITLGERHFD